MIRIKLNITYNNKMTVTLIPKVEEFQATMQHINGLAFDRTTGSVGETEAMLYIRDVLNKNNISL